MEEGGRILGMSERIFRNYVRRVDEEGAINEHTNSVTASHDQYLSEFGSFGALNQLNTGAS